MSDEQTRLLQAILEAVKEQTAFTKTISRRGGADLRANRSGRTVKIEPAGSARAVALVILLFSVAVARRHADLPRQRPDYSKPALPPDHPGEMPAESSTLRLRTSRPLACASRPLQ